MVGLPRRYVRLHQLLSDRDLAVLGSLAKLRVLSGRQIQRLHIPDGSRLTRLRRTQALLRRLHSHGLVIRMQGMVGGVRAGSSGYLYGLTGRGQSVLGVQGPYGKRRRRMWETKPYFQDHLLSIAEVFVHLEEAGRSQTLDVLDFQPEPQAWRRFSGIGGAHLILKPDAFVHIATARLEHLVFLEVDLDTESATTIYAKCLRYVAYWRSGVEQQRLGVFPRVIWLVPDEERRSEVIGIIGKLVLDAQQLFRVGLLPDVPHMSEAIKDNRHKEFLR